MSHEKYMKEALELARKGMGFVSPNPMVGAVIVKNGEIIGRGFHPKYGELHAERFAFADCDGKGIDCTGADMYVTLEPCCHHGKTPPCTEAVIQHRIAHVYIGSSDPNPLVAGKGTRILREHGIEVTEGILKDECDELNEIFFRYITAKKPFVTMKYAMTTDGKIACFTGESKWITGEEARLNVQKERLRHSAIMVGIGTVLADDPMLTCRLENSRNPIRIICDTHLRIPTDCNIVRTAREIPTIIATCSDDGKRLENMGCTVMTIPEKDSHIDLNQLIDRLADKTDSILLEGGGELNWAMLNAGLVDKVQAYIAPKIFGGASAKSPVSGMGVPLPSDAFMLTDSKIKQVGDDILIESRVKNVHRNN
ncbi:MAG: bifunctional diaminohydroxyphosphoribosylaminopyrimidine deaminase/5-amino-6-(5-phosphoribosylamino)uracil reductase RibD [Ruminococcus flavefaciens]|nr:bifunctional diaminohydroxyphosphoribosylaminopyrimidine deaminase/5-amino-6-(5-phosphoribosylamino)uracil reductase RibD [Ruminococcus flavefaciens]MCM1229614.1 bifunctional diaminohydroxyphosphoribosylaminopyrimidine deaminase/5-amino-6-(5-phosphoribosylamino)uracil reductase RibD [Ruminococcus flavefaciens]